MEMVDTDGAGPFAYVLATRHSTRGAFEEPDRRFIRNVETLVVVESPHRN